eukprot:2711142-Rhodomonas_salina.4
MGILPALGQRGPFFFQERQHLFSVELCRMTLAVFYLGLGVSRAKLSPGHRVADAWADGGDLP